MEGKHGLIRTIHKNLVFNVCESSFVHVVNFLF